MPGCLQYGVPAPGRGTPAARSTSRVQENKTVADIVLSTDRLAISTVSQTDLAALLRVRLSNPDRLLRTEGAGGEAGHYDLGMLERDVAVAAMDTARCLAAVRLADGGRVVGLLDLLLEHPDDGHPWIGAVEISRSEQRRGYGREVLHAAAGYLASERGEIDVHAAVGDDDEDAIAFLTACSFRTVGRRGNNVLMTRSSTCS